MVSDEKKALGEFFVKLLGEQLFTNMLVVDETLYLSRRKYGVPCHITLDFFKKIVLPYAEVVAIEEEDLLPAERYLLKYDLKLSDALHLATMEKAGVNRIVTEDSDFDGVEGVRRIWLDTPEE
jgi:hypothetical protein